MNALLDRFAPAFDLSARVMLAGLFIYFGAIKIPGYAGMQAYMQSEGVPGALLPLVIFVEVVGGLCLLVGYQARLSAFLLAGFSVLSALLFHSHLADQNEFIHFTKNLAIAGGLLMVVQHGTGAFSVVRRK
jgi:putative oxidoreductase